MISIIKSRKKNTVRRYFPENITSKDKDIFSGELNKTLPNVFLLKIKRVTIINYNLKIFGSLNIFQNQTHFYSFNTTQRIKNILRGYLIFFRKVNKNYIEEGIWICDNGGMNYFHWITDCLTRLVFAKNSIKINKVILPKSFENIDYVTDSLKALNFTPLFYSPNEKIIVKELFLPTKSAPTGNYGEDLLHLRKMFLSKSLQVTDPDYEKIYISRKFSKIRSLSNEKEVSNYLRGKGYKVLFTEELSLNEQINIFKSCKTLISLHGAGLTNQLFMPINSRVIEIRLEDQQKNNAYFSMSNILNHKYFYLNAKKGITENGLNFYKADISQIKDLI